MEARKVKETAALKGDEAKVVLKIDLLSCKPFPNLLYEF
jgi:hypothetical protein